MKLDFHPIANCWRLIEGERFNEMVEDIRANGLREPIVLFEDKILDGRNRYRACQLAGVEPYFVAYGDPEDSRIDWQRWEAEYDIREERGTLRIEIEPETDDFEAEVIEAEFKGALEDPIAFAKSVNEMRRHDDESQRAMTAARLATLPKGVRSDTAMAVSTPTQEQAASMMDVSIDSVQRARVVLDKGADELKEAVERGGVSVRAAADIAAAYADDKPTQAQIVARGEKEILEAAKQIRAEKARKSTETRLEKIAEISRGNAEMNIAQRFPVIYADAQGFHAERARGNRQAHRGGTGRAQRIEPAQSERASGKFSGCDQRQGDARARLRARGLRQAHRGGTGEPPRAADRQGTSPKYWRS